MRMRSIFHLSSLNLLSSPLQNRNDTPPLPILRALTLQQGNPLPPNLPTLLIPRDYIPLKDPLNLKPVLECSLKEARHNGPARVEPGHTPDSASRGKEPLHRSGEVLMLRAHPVAVRGDDAGKSSPVGSGEGVGEGSPFVGLDGDGGLL